MIHVVIVDDDSDNIDILKKVLDNDEFQVTAYQDPQLCLDDVGIILADIYILDVNMPVMNGFSLCKKLSDNRNSKEVPVVFLSAMDRLEDVQQGYDAGGIDYISKPYRPAELRIKIIQLASSFNKNKKLKVKTKEANGLALSALTESSRLGAALSFMQQAIPIQNPEILGNLIIQNFLDLDFNISLYIVTPFTEVFLSNANQPTNIEKKFLTTAHSNFLHDKSNTSRFKPIKGRLLIIYDNFLLLIKNYKEDEHHQFLDFFGIFGNSIEAQIKNIITIEKISREKKAESLLVTKNVAKKMSLLTTTVKNYENTLLSVMDELISEVRITSTSIDITMEQEAMLTQLVESAMKQLLQIYTHGVEAESEINAIISTLEEFINSCID